MMVPSKHRRTRVTALVLALSAGALAACSFIGEGVEYVARNRVLPNGWPACASAGTISEDCGRHDEKLIVDLHADSLFWNRDLRRRWSYGHTDFPRFAAGQVDIQIIGTPTITPLPSRSRGGDVCISRRSINTAPLVALLKGYRSDRTRTPAQARAYAQAAQFRKWTAGGGPTGVHPIYDRNDLNLVRPEGQPALLLSIEGVHWIDRIADVKSEIDELVSAGFRMFAPTHRFTNSLGVASEDCALVEALEADPSRREGPSAAHSADGAPAADSGLTPLGEAFIDHVIERGLIVDVAHASARTIADVSKRIVEARTKGNSIGLFMSHGGVAASCPAPRNLSDRSILDIVAAGGVIGIGVWSDAICFEWPQGDSENAAKTRAYSALDAMAAAYLVIVDRVRTAPLEFWTTAGLAEPPDPFDHIAIGADFDGAVKTPGDASTVARRIASYLERVTCNARDGALRKRLPADIADRRCKTPDTPVFAGAVARILGENAARVLAMGLREDYGPRSSSDVALAR